MRNSPILAAVLLFAVSCTKPNINSVNPTDSPAKPIDFTTYQILQGQQYCEGNVYAPINLAQLNFIAVFDSSAVYQTKTAENTDDINKLYGFSDNNAMHHQFSARIGWRWSNNALRLFGYVYNNGMRISEEIATVAIGAEVNCSIKISGRQYMFIVNGKTITMPRESTTGTAIGYKLYPYFGGDEVAPHTINIRIKDL